MEARGLALARAPANGGRRRRRRAWESHLCVRCAASQAPHSCSAPGERGTALRGRLCSSVRASDDRSRASPSTSADRPKAARTQRPQQRRHSPSRGRVVRSRLFIVPARHYILTHPSPARLGARASESRMLVPPRTRVPLSRALTWTHPGFPPLGLSAFYGPCALARHLPSPPCAPLSHIPAASSLFPTARPTALLLGILPRLLAFGHIGARKRFGEKQQGDRIASQNPWRRFAFSPQWRFAWAKPRI